MQIVRIGTTAALLLLLGTFAPAGARDDQHKEKQGKPDGHQGQSGQQRQQPQYNQGQRSQQARQQQQPYRSQQQASAWQQQRGWQQQGAWRGNQSWQNSRARKWEREHRSWSQRGGYGGYYIPQHRFSLYFGNQHWFRMHTRPINYGGYPRFDYGGYSFLIVDPWPEYWQENWYQSDDVYIDYDDGYYLHNRRQPGIRLAITIAL
jgi:hypothetical protein